MNNLIKYLLFIFLVGSQSFYAQNMIVEVEGTDSMMEKINKIIKQELVSDKATIVVNGHVIPFEDLKLFENFNRKDIPTISYISKNNAVKLYEEEGKNGVIIISTYKDELLADEYYFKILLPQVKIPIEDAIEKFEVYRFPLLILDGVPLRGDDIANKINSLESGQIKSIVPLKMEAGIKIYGIRAINGVLIITTEK